MKKHTQLFIGLLIGAVLFGAIPAFAETTNTITAIFDRVKLVVNGKMTDTSTLLYDGRTYIQLRGVANAFGAKLDWDEATNTATLTADVDLSDQDLTSVDTFIYDGIEITIGKDLKWDTWNSEYTGFNNSDVFGVPITVKNLSDKPERFPYFLRYTADGTRATDIGHYPSDSLQAIDANLPGASKSAYIYYLYDGDGSYILEFNDGLNGSKIITIPVKK